MAYLCRSAVNQLLEVKLQWS